MNKLVIYVDGSCLGNPGPGGWAGILSFVVEGEEIASKRVEGHIEQSTNNRMEIIALIETLKLVHTKNPLDIQIYTDSQYIVDGVGKLENWFAAGWRKKDGTSVANIDLWQQVIPLIEQWKPTMNWVRGHDTNATNRLVDAMAKAQARKDVGQ